MSIAIKPNVCSISSFKLSHSVVTQFKSGEWTSDEVSITTLHLMIATKKLKFECPTFMRNLAIILLLHLIVSWKYPCLLQTHPNAVDLVLNKPRKQMRLRGMESTTKLERVQKTRMI